MLEQQGIYNDFSPELRRKIEEKVDSYGKKMRIKFDVAKPNPDPVKYNGPTIYPFLYTLDPKTFKITDPYEKREGKQKVKNVGIVKEIDDKGAVKSFSCVRVSERMKGILELDLEVPEQYEMAMYAMVHPKLTEGMFADKQKNAVISIIDENKLATEQRALRSAKLKASVYAEKMSDKEVVEFANAMNWDSTEDMGIIRNKIEDLAENEPAAFNDLVQNDKMKFQAVVKQALDNKIISYDPIGNKILWVSTTQPIAQLGTEEDKNEVEKAALWFQLGGDNATKAFKKIESLLGSKQTKLI